MYSISQDIYYIIGEVIKLLGFTFSLKITTFISTYYNCVQEIFKVYYSPRRWPL